MGLFTETVSRGDNQLNYVHVSGTHNFTAAATNTITLNIPFNAVIDDLSMIVRTTITGPTSMTIGDGTDADRFGTGIALTDGTTVDASDATDGGLDGTAHEAIAQLGAAWNIVLTGTGGNFNAVGAIDYCIIYHYADRLTADLP